MPKRNKKVTKKGKDMPLSIVTPKQDRPFVKPTDPLWNPMEERTAKNGWCSF